jgi:cyclopropane fatty-acyl-phospholipid synthase-like methyltransferase
MTNRNKDKIYESYNQMYHWFDEHRSRDLFEKPYLDLAITYLEADATILDIGCGMGEPIGKYFIDKGFELTGIDGSSKLIELAKNRFPKAKFIIQDMREINLNEKFDIVIAWHSFFHLTQDDQKSMFKVFKEHIKLGGVLMFTSGSSQGEIWSDNGGEMLYHSSYSPKEYEMLLQENGFKIIKYALDDENCGGASVWMAQKV